jgi:hypothetical protein
MIEFREDDIGYLDWLDAHPSGFVLNVRRNPDPNYVVLTPSGLRKHHCRPRPRSLHWAFVPEDLRA